MLIEGDKERSPRVSATKVDARTTSNVVTPKILQSTHVEMYMGEVRVCKPFRVENAILLENFHYDGNSRVDRVGDDQYKRVWCCLSNSSREVTDNSGIDLEGGNVDRVFVGDEGMHVLTWNRSSLRSGQVES
jgi:hypothetical protein